MSSQDPRSWMWVEACRLLDRAERMQQQFFGPAPGGEEDISWEPPVDVFESDRALWILVALPGVGTDDLEVIVENSALTVVGRRRFPAEIRGTAIHRLELPHGRFKRRISLPVRSWRIGERVLSDGCLTICLVKDD